MNFFTILILTLSVTTLSFGQKKFEYTVSKPYKVIDAYSKYYFSDAESGKTLSVKIHRGTVYMQSFDARKMVEIKREKIKDLPKDYVLSNLVKIQDRIYFFYTLWDKRNKIQQLWVREIDFEHCNFKGAPKKLFELNERAYFSYLYSLDRSRLLLQCRKRPEKKRDAINYDNIGLFIFDKDLNQLLNNEVKMPYTEQQMDNLDYQVDKEGNPYILARVRADGSKKNYLGKGKNKTINYHLELIKINIKDKSFKTTKITLDKYRIQTIWLYEGVGNTMYCAGFYNKMENKFSENADGLFVFKLDKEGGIQDKTFHEIPVEILNQYQSVRSQKKNEKKEKQNKAEFSSLVMRKLIVQPDNSIILVGEQYFILTHTSTDANGNTTTRYTYHYYDILVTKIDSEGNLVWMRKLPKRQFGGAGRGGMGFKHMKIDGKHYFVYLDNVKNINLSIDKHPAVHRDGRGGYLTAYGLDDASGKVEKVSIFDTKEVGDRYKVYQFHTARILPISKDEFVVEFYKKGKEDLMVKVKVK